MCKNSFKYRNTNLSHKNLGVDVGVELSLHNNSELMKNCNFKIKSDRSLFILKLLLSIDLLVCSWAYII